MIRKILTCLLLAVVLVACGGEQTKNSDSNNGTSTDNIKTEETGKKSPDYAIKEVNLTNPLDAEMVKQGLAISEMKCTSCHSLEENRLVGPGWKGITSKREPAWIMNMITNVDVMLAEDEEAQKLLEECLVRMPNQNISVEESRSILEFMRSNDGEQ
ncbi:MAG: c-type cytochrome [Bacteroidia bacterium]